MKSCLKKTLIVFTLIMGAFSTAGAADKAINMKVKLDLAKSDQQNLQVFAKQLRENTHAIRNFVFEFSDSKDISKNMAPAADSPNAAEAIYRKNYPNGDFYYLIGDLDDDWTKNDFSRYYSVAKWLAVRGFRTIINVVAYAPDLQEAVSNSHTSAIVWNSHGSNDGAIYDSAKKALAKSIFTKNRSKSLKYILFANCYGAVSTDYYGLRKSKMQVIGWNRTVSSEDLFKYLFSEEFDTDLAQALNVKMLIKPKGEITL